MKLLKFFLGIADPDSNSVAGGVYLGVISTILFPLLILAAILIAMF